MSLALYNRGVRRVAAFCELNKILKPKITSAQEWYFDACAYYRPTEGIKIYLPNCARSCTENQVRNWNWPASVTDREPFGVICHELGHHCDWAIGKQKGEYFSDYSIDLEKRSGEAAITGYCPNPAEWFAEMFRLFVTNPILLQQIRPKTWELLRKDWNPLPSKGWREELGPNVPPKIVRTLMNKGAL